MEFKTFFHIQGDLAERQAKENLTPEEIRSLSVYQTGQAILRQGKSIEEASIGLDCIASNLEAAEKYESLRIEALGTFFSEDV